MARRIKAGPLSSVSVELTLELDINPRDPHPFVLLWLLGASSWRERGGSRSPPLVFALLSNSPPSHLRGRDRLTDDRRKQRGLVVLIEDSRFDLGMEHLRSVMDHSPGGMLHGKNLVDEMREMGKLRTAVMMEKCRRRNEVVMCPKPRRRGPRTNGEHNELKLADLSEIITSQASPPYYSVSPPIRASNPLTKDAYFCEQSAAQVPVLRVIAKGLDGASDRNTQSILTMA